MKLSELSTDRALDVLCELTPHVSGICEDADLVGTLGSDMQFDGMNLYGQFALLAGRIGKIAPILLRTHRSDVYGILSVLNERTVNEIADQPIADTIRQIQEVFRDSELLTFFKSFVRRERNELYALSADSPVSE